MNDCYLCRYLEPFNKMVPIYHPFERGVAEKVILAFAQDPEAQKAATEAGASKASLICSQVFGIVADPGCLSRNRPLSIPDPNFSSRIRIKEF